jgi:hypothetical protein
VYLVSSEGGGIRAAAWTVVVLSELQRQSGDRFWRCTLADSGVSGGSLGLALFAAHLRDGDKLNEAALEQIMTHDFLAPVLGSMFGVDQLQRFVPGRWVPDRGQALENAWIDAYRSAMGDRATSFAGPLHQLICDHDGCEGNTGRLLPALFLNSTAVASGRRVIQHPFAPATELNADHADLLTAHGAFAKQFAGAIDGANWLPAELPVSSAALNSARFTYVSPAGTVRRRLVDGDVRRLGQLVDGGYYENSGATTLIDFVRSFVTDWDLADRAVFVHISNDTGVMSVMPSSADQPPADACLVDNSTGAAPPKPKPARAHGETLSPLIALYQTREARGDQARRILASQGKPEGFWHFRLCAGKRPIPLGWTIGRETYNEMTDQLRGNVPVRARGFPTMPCEVVACGR